MAIEQDGLDLRQIRIVAVQVRPARLHHSDFRIGKVVDHFHQPLGLRREIGVKDGHELAGRYLQAGIERTGLEAFAVGAMVIADVVAHRGIALHHRPRDFHGFVGGIVEHLDFQLLARIFHLADALDQPVDDVLLVENRQLNGDPGQFGEVRRWVSHFVLAVLVVQVNQLIPVHAVKRQQYQHDEIGNQQRHVEGVGVIKALKCRIQKMRSHVVAQAMRFHQQTADQTECAAQECTLR